MEKTLLRLGGLKRKWKFAQFKKKQVRHPKDHQEKIEKYSL